MKLINIEVSRFMFSEDIEIDVFFYKWHIAKFRVDTLTIKITRK